MRLLSWKAALPLLLIGTVLVMVVPIPPQMLDVLLTVNISLAVLTLFAVLVLRDPLHMAVFPSLLLIATLIRLALNVSSTRLILLEAYAGEVINTFGNFVVAGSVIVGMVVFLILVIVQFVVVTQGSGRAAEVAARFALDGMPGKQMAIDADLSAGLIDEREARERRDRIAQEADMASAMEGAAKFVKGDAIAGIVIVIINIVGGFSIGVGMEGMDFLDAANTYSLLTVGDGLVTVIPSLLLSVSAGLLVTRVTSDRDLPEMVSTQLFGNPPALRVAGGVAIVIGLIPGLPLWAFGLIGASLLFAASRTTDRSDEEKAEGAEEAPAVAAQRDDPEALVGQMQVEPLELRVAYDLLDLLDSSRGGDLLGRVKSLRSQIASELGIIMPRVRSRDEPTLDPSTYKIMLNGASVAGGSAPPERMLALPSGDGEEIAGLGGEETVEPVFGLKAYWIPTERASAAQAAGATVVDRASTIVTHLAEVVRSSAAQLLSRQQVQVLVDEVRKDQPLLADEVGSDKLPYSRLHQVLRTMLEDRVPIRDMASILEAVTARAAETTDIGQLVSAARAAVGGQIVEQVASDGKLAVASLEPGFEAGLHERLRTVDGVAHLAASPDELTTLRDGIASAHAQADAAGLPLIVVCAQQIRAPLQRAVASVGTEVPVLAFPELPSHVSLTPTEVIGRATAKS